MTELRPDVEEAAATQLLSDLDAGEPEGPRRSLWNDAWRLLRRRPLFWISAVLITIFTLMAIVPQLFVWPSPATHSTSGLFCNLADSKQAPSSEHWFGTDQQGCDYYIRVIYGARVSMRVALGATAMTVFFGLLLGGAAAYYGGKLDTVLSRLADGFFALPYLVGAIIILSALAGGEQRTEWHVLTAIAFLGWPALLRLFRSSVLQIKNLEYVDAARALGASDNRIMARHILPNAIAPVIVYSTVSMGAIISVEATLSFLGIGLPLGTISWGIMINDAQSLAIANQAEHMLIFPAIALILISLAFVLMGEELREAFDPRLR